MSFFRAAPPVWDTANGGIAMKNYSRQSQAKTFKGKQKTKDEHYRDFSTRKPYNDARHKLGQILAPFVTDNERAKHYGFNLNNLETWHFSGKKILVGFTWVDPEQFDGTMRIFNQDVNRQLHPNMEDTDDLSLDAMLDAMDDNNEEGYDPTGTTEKEDLALLKISLDMLLESYRRSGKDDYADVLAMLGAGYTKKEVAASVRSDLKKSPYTLWIPSIQQV